MENNLIYGMVSYYRQDPKKIARERSSFHYDKMLG